MTCAVATEEHEGEEGEHYGQLCCNGTIQRLDDRVVDHGFVINAAQDVGVFAHAVEHHDGVMH